MESAPAIFTIGVYGSSQAQFGAALRTARVETLVDVRQRRGVRGPEYAWANARRLQDFLAAQAIGYVHRRDLAPTTEIRETQYREDARQGVGKRTRVVAAPEYVRRYSEEILDHADVMSLLELGRFALFCVERDAATCHRSLIAARLVSETGLDVTHLVAA